MSRLSLRSHYWGSLVVVVAAGDLDVQGAGLLANYLRRLDVDNDIVVDLWDVTHCDPEGVSMLEHAKHRTEAAGWGFAIVADPDGPCTEALEGASAENTIRTYADRHSARAALQM